jgi:DNA-binding transcriptional MocR family regulator
MSSRATSAKLARTELMNGVVAEIGDWTVGPGPLYRLLARSLATGIERGALRGGTRLPSERALAAELSINRGTAVAAYDLLVADQLIERTRGSGTFVTGSAQTSLPPGREGSTLVHRLVDRSAAPADSIDLSLSVIHAVEDLPDVSLSMADLTDVRPETGYTPWGLPGLRTAIAEHIGSRWGLTAQPGQIVITTGAQQAINVAASCWVRPGDTVVVEDPTYPGAVSAFVQAGARLRGVAVDRYGVRPDDLAAAVADRPALVYLQPTVHSPTGSVLSEQRRRDVAAVLSTGRIPLVEDMALADLAWHSTPLPIASVAHDTTVAVIGSLSKLFWGGLRIGFACAPEPVALRFARVKATQDLGSSAVSQVLAERLLREAARSDFVERRRRDLRHRYGVLAAAVREKLPQWHWDEPQGGLSIWVRLPEASGEHFAHVARTHRVVVATAGPLSPSVGADDRIRLSFSAPPDVLTEAVRRLAEAWHAMSPDHRRPNNVGTDPTRPTEATVR